MKKPSIEEAKQYAKEKNLVVDFERWWYTNDARGWVVMTKQGPIPMKNWKSNMQVWSRNQIRYGKPQTKENYNDGESFRSKYERKANE